MSYKYKRERKKHIWQGENIRVVFKDFTVEETSGFTGDYVVDEDIENILYYGYDFELQQKEKNGNNISWKTLFDVASSEETGCLVAFYKNMIKVLDDDFSNCQKLYDIEGNLDSVKVSHGGGVGFDREDYFKFERKRRVDTDFDVYTVEIGKDAYADNIPRTQFVKFSDLSAEDVLELKRCIEDFFQSGYNRKNRRVLKEWERAKGGKRVSGNLLISNSNVYCAGDKFRRLYYWNNGTPKIIRKVVIADINSDGIELICESGQLNVHPDEIIFDWEENGQYRFDEIRECVDDFFNAIVCKSQELIDDFKTMSQKELYDKYAYAITERYYIRRYDDNFEDLPLPKKQKSDKFYAKHIIREVAKKVSAI